MEKDRGPQTDASHEADTEGHLFNPVGQRCAETNDENVPNWLGIAMKLGTIIHR